MFFFKISKYPSDFSDTLKKNDAVTMKSGVKKKKKEKERKEFEIIFNEL